jgi:energy-converting hydrogenase Eha subunit A
MHAQVSTRVLTSRLLAAGRVRAVGRDLDALLADYLAKLFGQPEVCLF